MFAGSKGSSEAEAGAELTLLRIRPLRLQPTPWQQTQGTRVLENGQGFGVSISSPNRSASL